MQTTVREAAVAPVSDFLRRTEALCPGNWFQPLGLAVGEVKKRRFCCPRKKSVGRKQSGIKGVCRANPATPDLRRPATPVGVSKRVTVSDFRYEVYTGERKGLSVSRLFCVTKGVKG